jgi:hypothetical protein
MTRIDFALDEHGPVTLDVLDLQGRIVRTLSRSPAAPARYSRRWDLADAAGNRVKPGVYFVRLRTRSFERTRRLVVL